MRRSLFAVLALASLLPTIALANNNDDCVRVNQVRAFAAETDTSLIVRQGKGQFKRITVQAGCPIEDADRIGFAVGSQQLYTQAVDGRFIPTNSTNLQNRFCTASRHTYLTVIRDNEDLRSRCKIQAIETVDRGTFDAAGAVRDNRR
jgi:hypothetical protein